MKKSFLFLIGLFLISTAAYSWTATFLGGNNWAVICANGTAFSYAGSSAGLDVVGPALCPGGVTAPIVGHGVKIGIDHTINVNILKNQQETTETSVQKIRTYPPHGYPCLGCVPCPGNPTEFCDINNQRIVFVYIGTDRQRDEPIFTPRE